MNISDVDYFRRELIECFEIESVISIRDKLSLLKSIKFRYRRCAAAAMDTLPICPTKGTKDRNGLSPEAIFIPFGSIHNCGNKPLYLFEKLVIFMLKSTQESQLTVTESTVG
jgi:hypothetical protein